MSRAGTEIYPPFYLAQTIEVSQSKPTNLSLKGFWYQVNRADTEGTSEIILIEFLRH